MVMSRLKQTESHIRREHSLAVKRLTVACGKFLLKNKTGTRLMLKS